MTPNRSCHDNGGPAVSTGMNVALWAAQILLAAVFLYSALTKGLWSRQRLLDAGQTGVARIPMPLLRFVAGAEFMAVLGLLGPGLTGVWPMATPLAAMGLAIVMIGAAAVHLTQNEAKTAIGNFGLLLLALLVYFGRMGYLDPLHYNFHPPFSCHTTAASSQSAVTDC